MAQLYPRALSSLFIASYDSEVYGGGILTRLHPDLTTVEVEVTLRPMVSRLVRLGVLPLLDQVTRCYIYLSDNYFLYFSCRAPFLTRGPVCNLQCNDASF
jgi:hypothetical protein